MEHTEEFTANQSASETINLSDFRLSLNHLFGGP